MWGCGDVGMWGCGDVGICLPAVALAKAGGFGDLGEMCLILTSHYKTPFEMHQFSFERLDVWQRARALSVVVYQISKNFSPDERFGLTQQIRRAVVSITCNLAEGSSRHTRPDKARFTEIAYGSLMEVLNILIVAVDLNIIEVETLESTRPLIEEISNKLNRLRESQLR